MGRCLCLRLRETRSAAILVKFEQYLFDVGLWLCKHGLICVGPEGKRECIPNRRSKGVGNISDGEQVLVCYDRYEEHYM